MNCSMCDNVCQKPYKGNKKYFPLCEKCQRIPYWIPIPIHELIRSEIEFNQECGWREYDWGNCMMICSKCKLGSCFPPFKKLGNNFPVCLSCYWFLPNVEEGYVYAPFIPLQASKKESLLVADFKVKKICS